MRAWLALLLLVPLAAGGSPEDPEVTDAIGDHLGGAPADPFLAWDIDIIYFAAEGCPDGHDWVWLGLDNILEDNRGNPGALVTGTVFFQVAGSPFRVVARGVANQDGQAEPVFKLYGAGLDKDVAGDYHFDNTAPEGIHWCLPHADVGMAGDAVTGIWGQTMLEDVDEADREELDRAPDDAPTTTGRAWILGGFPDAIAVLNVTASETTASIQGGNASFLLLLRNDGNADATVDVAVEDPANWTTAGENWTVSVQPASVLVAAGAGASVGIDATWQGDAAAVPDTSFPVHWQSGDQNGTLQLTILGNVGPPTVQPNGTAGPGNETSSPVTKDSPLPLAPLLIATLAVAVLRRRR